MDFRRISDTVFFTLSKADMIMEYIKDNEKWQPTREEYFKLEEKYRDLENSYIHLYNVR